MAITIEFKKNHQPTPRMRLLLDLLTHHAPNPVTHQQVANYVGNYSGGPKYNGDYSRELVGQLRKRLADPDQVVTVRGVGYRLKEKS